LWLLKSGQPRLVQPHKKRDTKIASGGGAKSRKRRRRPRRPRRPGRITRGTGRKSRKHGETQGRQRGTQGLRLEKEVEKEKKR